MTAALPAMVDCEPYRARLTAEACARKYVIASGGIWKTGDRGGQGMVVTAQMRMSLCNGCQVGQKRAEELGVTGAVVKRERKQSQKAPVPPAPDPEKPAASEEQVMEQELPKKDCQQCGNEFQPTSRRGKPQRFCGKPCADKHSYEIRIGKKPWAEKRKKRGPAARSKGVVMELVRWANLVQASRNAEVALSEFEADHQETMDYLRTLIR